MTAPTPSALQAPDGRRMTDGYGAAIVFAANPTIAFWEVSVTPPGIEAEEPIELASMRSTTWRMKAMRRLKTLTDGSVTVNYDPDDLPSISSLVGQNTTVTWHYPNGATLAHYGGLQSFTPNEQTDGEEPTAELVIVATNMDPTTCAEEGPLYTAGTGTGAC